MLAIETYLLLALGFVLIRDYIQWRRSLECQEKLVDKLFKIFGGGVVVSAAPGTGGAEVSNEIVKEDPNEIDIQDMTAFDLPKDFKIEVEEAEVAGG